MQQHIWVVHPTGDLFSRAEEVLRQAGFILTPLPQEELPSDQPFVLLADLSGDVDRVIATLERLPLSPGQDDIRLLLVPHHMISALPHLLSRGLCVAWAEHEPPEHLVERVRGLLERYAAMRREHRLQAMVPLYSLAQSFADLDNLQALLQRVLETAIQETGADRGSIMLLEEEGNYLYIGAAVGLPEHIVREQRQRVGEGIAGWVAEHRRPLILTEGEIPPFALPWLRGRNAYSSISLPMIHQNHLLGVLNLTKNPGRPPFQEGDAEFIGILAVQAAAVIRNARLYMRLQHAYRDLQQLDRLRTQIIDIAAHELRTPVTVIKGYFELIRELNMPELDALLPPIERNLERLETLVRDLFDLSTLRSLERVPRPRPVDIPRWLEEHLARYREQATAAGIHLDHRVDAAARSAVFDPEHLTAILRHLISNAIKFTPRGGRVQVTVERVPPFLAFHVDDSGPGIPEEERHRVFEEFYQVEEVSTRSHEGLGVGLSLARALARAHGGTIEIADGPLGGARVSVLIPQEE